ncbi:uncharacterized protein L3040_006816 [Drepanopeziza brunnea f. sp. 'multigermtubi']|uniref:Uncharacterized protein n=1 Tax=Marssonina brunnea f. sp. multigermtubi (strain MB_m1) TaxID=1072389 RepID=K1X2D8_MARBU|nr:uncharacterized protein MBM_02638 [Drepanopeziza brunnea f. sp. 'multigermtubi' MB_m1]EKD19401.1 hypothetical protein MBM_02638 [Drepanopeziza brunnea f. sp. 'multigermtubi' MB_m1]KAJ5037940.1 hypothetical protein L3040_006816 [Drepanopeziza brunnea f. sp. 'multigermtubi']
MGRFHYLETQAYDCGHEITVTRESNRFVAYTFTPQYIPCRECTRRLKIERSRKVAAAAAAAATFVKEEEEMKAGDAAAPLEAAGKEVESVRLDQTAGRPGEEVTEGREVQEGEGKRVEDVEGTRRVDEHKDEDEDGDWCLVEASDGRSEEDEGVWKGSGRRKWLF